MVQKNKLFFLVKYFANDDMGHYLIELLMLEFGLVNLLRFNLAEENKNKLLKILKPILVDNSFKFLVKDNFIYIFKDEIDLDEKKINQPGYLGRQLGFPNCCIKNHLAAKNRERQIENINIDSLNDWRLNIFYHESIYHLIPHWPCSFNCQASLNMAIEFWQKLKNNFPEFIDSFQDYLKGDFWHIYAIDDEMHIKTKFSNDIVFRLDGAKVSDQEFVNIKIKNEEFYNLNDYFKDLLEIIAEAESIRLINSQEFFIKNHGKNQRIKLPKDFRQLTKFISFR